MAEVFYDRDAPLEPLSALQIGVIGYGNQGRAHALNLRDSGFRVMAGVRKESPAWDQATRDHMPVASLEEVAANSQVLALMLPDEVLPPVYQKQIEPYLSAQTTFFFAHGFAVHHHTIKLPDDADICLVAPTGPGRQVRSLYQGGNGLPALIAVEQDYSGYAWQKCLAYARGIGSTRAGAIKTTFSEETVVDLYCEQAVLCGGIPALIKSSFDTLVSQGYQPELAYISCLKEVKLIADLLFSSGIDGMRSAISTTAKFGSALAGPRLINSSTEKNLRAILHDIESGKFARVFEEETKAGSPTVKLLLKSEKNSSLARTGRTLKEFLRF